MSNSTKENINISLKGHVKVFDNGQLVCEKHNDVQSHAAIHIAKAIGGLASVQLSFISFQNASSEVDTIEAFHGIPISPSDGVIELIFEKTITPNPLTFDEIQLKDEDEDGIFSLFNGIGPLTIPASHVARVEWNLTITVN